MQQWKRQGLWAVALLIAAAIMFAAACGDDETPYVAGCEPRPNPAKGGILVDSLADGAPALAVEQFEPVIASLVAYGGAMEVRTMDERRPPLRLLTVAPPAPPVPGKGKLRDKQECEAYLNGKLKPALARNEAQAQRFRAQLATLLANPPKVDNPWSSARDIGLFFEQADALAAAPHALLVISSRPAQHARCAPIAGETTPADPGVTRQVSDGWWLCVRSGAWVRVEQAPKLPDGSFDLGPDPGEEIDGRYRALYPLPEQLQVAVLKSRALKGFIDPRADAIYVDAATAVAWLAQGLWPPTR